MKISEELKIKVKQYFQNKSLNGNAIMIALKKNEELREELEIQFKKYPDLYQSIAKLALIIIHDIQLSKCIVCGKTLNYNATLNGRQRKFCSNKCKLSKEGNPFAQKDVKDKIKENCIKKYGVDNPAKSKEVQEKMQNTCLDKYGVKNVYQSQNIKKKIKDTFKKHFGDVNSIYAIPELKEKAWKTKKNNTYNRIIEKYKGKIEPLFSVNQYQGVGKIYKWKCLQCGNIFEAKYDDGYIKSRCFKCYPRLNSFVSSYEKEIAEYIKSLGFIVDTTNRQIIKPYQLDIVIPEKKLAIEFNGIYWHSTKVHSQSNYHLNKTELCEAGGYQLIHIWQHQWVDINKQCVIKQDLKRYLIGFEETEQYQIKNISKKEKDIFLNQHSISGTDNSKIYFGYFNRNEMVGIVTLNKKSDGIIEIKNLIGTDLIKQKLIQYIQVNYKFNRLEISVDRSYFQDDMVKYGFKLDRIIQPQIFDIEEKVAGQYLQLYDCGYLIYYKEFN